MNDDRRVVAVALDSETDQPVFVLTIHGGSDQIAEEELRLAVRQAIGHLAN